MRLCSVADSVPVVAAEERYGTWRCRASSSVRNGHAVVAIPVRNEVEEIADCL
jgi:hypothetical protein